MSWVVNLAEKGGTLLTSLDGRMAELLKADEQASAKPVVAVREKPDRTPPPLPPSPPPPTSVPSSNVFSSDRRKPAWETAQTQQKRQKDGNDDDAALFEFLNDPAPINHITNPSSCIVASSVSPERSSTEASVTADACPATAQLPVTVSGDMGHIQATVSSCSASVPSPAPSHLLPREPPEGSGCAPATLPPSVAAAQVALENKCLHSEVSSLNQEVTSLVQRNHKTEEDNARLRNQVFELERQLQNANAKLLELENVKAIPEMSRQNRSLKSRLESLSQKLVAIERSLAESEEKAAEARKQAELSTARADHAQREVSRISRYLSEYKEKASHILANKEKLIEELQQSKAGNKATCAVSASAVPEEENVHLHASQEEVGLLAEAKALRAEVTLLREEEANWRAETERRELAFQELETQLQFEHASLRRTLEVLEQQLTHEKQLRAESEKELLDLHVQLSAQEERAAREKVELHSLVQSNEAELARMRRMIAEGREPVVSQTSKQLSAPPPRTDTEQILALEARLRQLNDSLITKQDALDAVLAQNHGLKIRLERLDSENEVRLLSSSNAPSELTFQNGHPQRPSARFSSSYGFARLHLIESSIPASLRAVIVSLDGLIIGLVGFLRRHPLFRLLFILYLFFLHLWFGFAFFLYAPAPLTSSPHPVPHP
uniref:Golgin subfamily A member 5 n=1 Tax=Schistocephalus solidus TaxID=70667 RepID=A0A0X3PYV4_SCHSO